MGGCWRKVSKFYEKRDGLSKVLGGVGAVADHKATLEALDAGIKRWIGYSRSQSKQQIAGNPVSHLPNSSRTACEIARPALADRATSSIVISPCCHVFPVPVSPLRKHGHGF